jgi:hypothetical protein
MRQWTEVDHLGETFNFVFGGMLYDNILITLAGMLLATEN